MNAVKPLSVASQPAWFFFSRDDIARCVLWEIVCFDFFLDIFIWRNRGILVHSCRICYAMSLLFWRLCLSPAGVFVQQLCVISSFMLVTKIMAFINSVANRSQYFLLYFRAPVVEERANQFFISTSSILDYVFLELYKLVQTFVSCTVFAEANSKIVVFTSESYWSKHGRREEGPEGTTRQGSGQVQVGAWSSRRGWRVRRIPSWRRVPTVQICSSLIREKQLSDEVFRITEWGPEEEDKEDLNVWEDNWDDDQAEDDFSVQLK